MLEVLSSSTENSTSIWSSVPGTGIVSTFTSLKYPNLSSLIFEFSIASSDAHAPSNCLISRLRTSSFVRKLPEKFIFLAYVLLPG